MSELTKTIQKMLESKQVNIFIGYGKGIGDKPIPLFVTRPELAEKFIYNEKCTQNLVAYIHKPEIIAYGKIGILVSVAHLRAILQLASEKHIKEGSLIAISVTNDGKVHVMENLADMLSFVQSNFIKQNEAEKNRIEEIMSMNMEERWHYWVDTLERCIKCYACRSACPMCYCERCTTDCNQPQWIPTANHAQGNFEWHIMRAMHLAGRCVDCNECARACPVDIPLNLLTAKLNADIEECFGDSSGLSLDQNYALSNFKFEDKESFIR